jgi:hypothetical protein
MVPESNRASVPSTVRLPEFSKGISTTERAELARIILEAELVTCTAVPTVELELVVVSPKTFTFPLPQLWTGYYFH